ncbi:MAG: SGNH/GDSL hydrolase family protein [Phycisphaerales bacterium]
MSRSALARCARAFVFVLVASLIAHGPARADVNLYEVVCFGDSLTDNQSILPIYSGLPSTLYGHDPMELLWEKNRGSRSELSNYAVAGFTSDLVDLQVELYEFNTFFWYQPHATLFQLEMGGNDVLNNDFLLANHAVGVNGAADAVIDTIIRNFDDYIQDLREDARRDAKAVLWTIPHIGVTPRYFNQFTATQLANLEAHIERANNYIRSYGRFGNVVVLDLFEIVVEWANEPPVVNGLELGAPPNHGETTDLFADEIHPTAVSNGLIANELIALMNDKWDANFDFYSELELYDFAINGGWNPAPGTAAVLLIFAGAATTRRRFRA